MLNFAHNPLFITFALSAMFCFGLSLRVAFALAKPIVSTLVPTYALTALLIAYPFLYWFNGSQGGAFGWIAATVTVVGTILFSIVVFIGSLLLHPWEQTSIFDGPTLDPKSELEQRYPDCRVKRLHSGQWLLTSRATGKTVDIVGDSKAAGQFFKQNSHKVMAQAEQTA